MDGWICCGAPPHLDAGVHLHEVEALLLPQELDCASALVVDGLGGRDGGVAHCLADLQSKGRHTRVGR
eukprot:10175-Chlamydomonas_euryale.AAC.3